MLMYGFRRGLFWEHEILDLLAPLLAAGWGKSTCRRTPSRRMQNRELERDRVLTLLEFLGRVTLSTSLIWNFHVSDPPETMERGVTQPPK